MLKGALAAGLIIAAGMAFLAGDLHVWVRWMAYASAASAVLAIIAGGAASSGDRIRANYASETTADRAKRFAILGGALAFSVVTGGLAALVWFVGGRW